MSGTTAPEGAKKTTPNASIALGADIAKRQYGLTGTGIRVGVISISYDNLGGAAQDVARGDLPNNVTVLKDMTGDPAKIDDEARAMAELVYEIAPGAGLFIHTSGTGIADCATAVDALAAAGCNIIIDDVSYSNEGFYQLGSVLDSAVRKAVAAGISYFTAASNDDKLFYEAGFAPAQVPVAGLGTVTAMDFGNGRTRQTVTIAASPDPTDPRQAGGTLKLLMQWAQPFKSMGDGTRSARNSLALSLLDKNGAIVAKSDLQAVDGDPVQPLAFVNRTADTSFSLMIVQNGGTVPAGQLFKYIFEDGNSATIDDPNLGKGSGNIYGHALLAEQNSTGAASWRSTPAYGVSPTVVEDFSGVGPGVLLFAPDGTELTGPLTLSAPTFVAIDGSDTAVPRFAPFTGTSASAPNAGAVGALVLEANKALTPAQLTEVLRRSAIPTGSAASVLDSGAGLIQARAAVQIAVGLSGIAWTAGNGGDWATPSAWAGGLIPSSANAVLLGNDQGRITSPYTVVLNSGTAAVGSLAMASPGTAAVTLTVQGGTLVIANTGTSITGNELLVASGAALTQDAGRIQATGILNVNAGTVALRGGSASTAGLSQSAGTLTVGGLTGHTVTADLGTALTLGGVLSILDSGTLRATTATATGGAVTVGAGGSLEATGSLTLSGSVTFRDAGQVRAEGAISITKVAGTIAAGGSLTAGSLHVAGAGGLSIDGRVRSLGGLTGDGTGRFGIGAAGWLDIGGGMAGATVALTRAGARLILSSRDPGILTAGYTAPVEGLNQIGTGIDFTGVPFASGLQATVTGGTMALLDGSSLIASLSLAPAPAYDLVVVDDGAGHALVRSVACFLEGTQIETDHGPVPVEDLAVGDRVRSGDGGLRPVRWIGHRRLDPVRHRQRSAVDPVRIRAGAFRPGVPGRDLYLSPDHAVHADGVLIPVKYLLNGRSITQERSRRPITYFHVELDRHDIVLAEGLTVESFLNTGQRQDFDGAGGVVTLHPDFRPWMREAAAHAPLVVHGPELDRVRQRLDQRAAPRRQRMMISTRRF